MDTSKKRISDLGFDSIKKNHLEHFQNQDYWKDYDFEASGLNLLIDQLAYATHYNAFYANMLATEMFIDTSKLRSSVVSHAKSLSYTPGSIKASDIIVDIEVREGTGGPLDSVMILDKGSAFFVKGQDKAFKFITDKAYTSTLENGKHVFEDVVLYQGSYKSIDFIVDNKKFDQRFILPHNKIDMSLVEVYVQEGTDDTKLEKYVYAPLITNVDKTSKVYYTEESEDSRFRIMFGDGILGKPVEDGKIIRIVYFETDGPAANGLSDVVYTLVTNNPANRSLERANVSITANEASSNGNDAESVESIRVNAPRNYLTRDRAITSDDWKFVILNNFSDVRNVKVWGGEDEDEEFGHYGKVYLSLNSKGSGVFTENRKKEILEYLKDNHRILGISPEIVDPETIWIILDCTAHISLNETFADSGTISTKIRNNVETFSDTNMIQFDKDFEYSKLTKIIDDSDPGIMNNLLNVQIEHRIKPFLGKEYSYEIYFRNAVKRNSITSNRLTWRNQIVQFEDDGKGNLHLFKINDDLKTIVLENAGKVDYGLGKIFINPVYIQSADPVTFDLRVRATPVSNNIYARNNKILKIDSSILDVNIKIS